MISKPSLHLAVNSRLVQFLKSYLLDDSFVDSKVAITPQVMTWQQVLNVWQEQQMLLGNLSVSDLPSRTLSNFEAQLIWQRLLEEDPLVSALLNKTEMAKKLYQAWQVFSEYLSYDLLHESFKTEEINLFLQLKKNYIEFLEQNNYWDSSLKIKQQLDWIAQSPVEFAEINLYGFDEKTPYLQSWLDGLQARGVVIKQIAQFDLTTHSTMNLCVASSQTIEAQQAASWAYDLVEKGDKNIAIVAPNIDEVQQNLSWALDELMWSQQNYPLQSLQKNWQGSPLYNISLGQSLSSFSLVKHALQLVKVLLSGQKKIDYELFSSWLVSPYTTGNLLTRQSLDFNLRKWQWAKLSLNNVVDKMQHEDCKDKFSKQLHSNIISSLESISGGKVSSFEFVELVFKMFSSMHWAEKVGDRGLTSHEYQQKEALFSALEVFKNNLFPQEQQSFSEWLNLVEKFLAEQIFQPKNIGQSPIQIMGMLEAGGQQFDGLWVMGMTSEAWPRDAKPNPFLPINLQREYKVPRADSSRELAYAQTLSQRLSKSSANIVWSFAKLIEGREQIQSPVLNPFKHQFTSYQQQAYKTLAEQAFAIAKPLDKVLDNKAPMLADGTEVTGGAGFIAAQAVCPLMAFLDYRLGAKNTLEAVEEGVQKNNLGLLVHKILERFWQEVKTQSALLADNDFASKVDRIVGEELELVKNSYQENFLQIEHQRILNLIVEWLELEETRPSFEVIKVEGNYGLNIAELIFQIKLDRVDKVAGKHYVLDYKTGSASINQLTKQPLVKPQLAVYLHAKVDDVAGLGYALIRSDDEVKFSSLSCEEHFKPTTDKNQLDFEKLAEKEKSVFYGMCWQEALDYLKQQVTDLANSIKEGNAELSYQKETDLQYAGCLLALRLPEAKEQISFVLKSD